MCETALALQIKTRSHGNDDKKQENLLGVWAGCGQGLVPFLRPGPGCFRFCLPDQGSVWVKSSLQVQKQCGAVLVGMKKVSCG